MAERILYIIAYDITDDKRLNRIRNFLKGYSTGGQKSVYECYLNDREFSKVVDEVKQIINENEDRVHIFQVDRRTRFYSLGIATPPRDPYYFYFG